MKRVSMILAMLCLSFAVLLNPVQAEKDVASEEKPKVVLTDKQKEELQELHEDMLEDKKEIIKKYIEYGVLTEEKGTEIIEKMEGHFKKLEENGYIPTWDKHHHHHDKD
ncbi:YckD family protein [Bacillus sp. AK128]